MKRFWQKIHLRLKKWKLLHCHSVIVLKRKCYWLWNICKPQFFNCIFSCCMDIYECLWIFMLYGYFYECLWMIWIFLIYYLFNCINYSNTHTKDISKSKFPKVLSQSKFPKAFLQGLLLWWLSSGNSERLQVDRVTSWQGDKMTRWQDDKVTRWQGDKVTRWQGDKLTSWQVDKLTSWQGDKLTSWQVDKLTS